MVRQNASLDDKYKDEAGKIYLNCRQAIVRIPIIRQKLDKSNELNNSAFVTGYRGAAFNTLDLEYQKAEKFLDENNIKFQKSINEEISIEKALGTQLSALDDDFKYDGVSSFIYASSFGLGRTVSALKLANMAGSSENGGVLVIAADDISATSSINTANIDNIFEIACMPIFSPADIKEVLDYSLHAIAISRFSGCWAGMKIATDIACSTSSIFTNHYDVAIKIPPNIDMPRQGLNIQNSESEHEQIVKLMNYKIPAVLEYIKLNKLNKPIYELEEKVKKRLVIITSGKAFKDVMQAFRELGLTEDDIANTGIVIYKLAVIFPLLADDIIDFTKDAENVLVVEENSNLIHKQLAEAIINSKEQNINLLASNILQNYAELSPREIAKSLVPIIAEWFDKDELEQKLELLETANSRRLNTIAKPRLAYFCAGCPNNTATKLPDGAKSITSGGCSYIASKIDKNTKFENLQMGTVGAIWQGKQEFVKDKHIFVNLGDASYFHSAILAIRDAVINKANITYKILYNGVGAFSGGQDLSEQISVARLARQIAEEGVRRIIIVTDNPDKYADDINFPSFVSIEHRDDLNYIQKHLQEYKAVSVIIYDQACAIAKKRAIKNSKIKKSDIHLFINDKICDGCGDCSLQSNCLAVVPKTTKLGRKRQIDQYSCMQDFACLNGNCPSFISIYGGKLKPPALGMQIKQDGESLTVENKFSLEIAKPNLPQLDKDLAILIAGVGRQGVTAITNILSLAAHLEDKGTTSIEYDNIDRKNGPVISHLRIAKKTEDILTNRINLANADIVLGLDLLTVSEGRVQALIKETKTKIITNEHVSITHNFINNPRWNIKSKEIMSNLTDICGEDNLYSVEATDIVKKLFGNSIFVNIFMLGYAWQLGVIPVSQGAIMRAIEMNEIDIDTNKNVFLWGRLAAFDLDKLLEVIEFKDKENIDIDKIIDTRYQELKKYQNENYANSYQIFIEKIREKEKQYSSNSKYSLTKAVAKNLYNLMAFKDEYEIARLYTDKEFWQNIKDNFTGKYKIKFNLVPIIWAKRFPDTGIKQKEEFGYWVFYLFKILAFMKYLRGSIFDIFALKKQNREARKLVKEYKKLVLDITDNLNEANYQQAIKIAKITERIAGFGHVREQALQETKKLQAELLEEFFKIGKDTEKQLNQNDDVAA